MRYESVLISSQMGVVSALRCFVPFAAFGSAAACPDLGHNHKKPNSCTLWNTVPANSHRPSGRCIPWRTWLLLPPDGRCTQHGLCRGDPVQVVCQSLPLSSGLPTCSINARMSSALHTVVRGPSFTGLGKRPVRHPSHHALLLMGIMARICGRRRKP